MAKYADITPFYEWLDNIEELDNSRYADYQTLMLYEIRDELDSLPELLRCKNCKWRQQDEVNRNFCGLGDFYCGDTDFCSRGERKTDERTD